MTYEKLKKISTDLGLIYVKSDTDVLIGINPSKQIVLSLSTKEDYNFTTHSGFDDLPSKTKEKIYHAAYLLSKKPLKER